MTAAPRPAPDPGALQSPAPGTVDGSPRPLASRPHILVVNGRKVRNPVFIIGAPVSGAEMLAGALKRSGGFHVTMGQRWVVPVVQAFARSPSLARGRAEAAATVLRDAFAQGWQISSHSCLACTAQCREAGGAKPGARCVTERDVSRYGDASPELMYCADSLVDAFPDARLIQVIRDGRDVVAGMLADADALAWFRPGFVNLESELTHPLLGVDSEWDRTVWEGLSLAGKCAMRWRGTVRLAARLRAKFSSEQLITLRYEEVIRQPAATAEAVSGFVGAEVVPVQAHAARTVMAPGAWRRLLTPAQAADTERVAGEELRRVGYGPLCPSPEGRQAGWRGRAAAGG
ncbi:MAG TPA: sulfotransferase [Streptosporangiaceae bacterium]